jgi:hypothetical protein
MKRIFLATLFCAGFVSAQNATVVSNPALFLIRVSVLPSKAATLGAFQVLFASIAFIPAALVAMAIKQHVAENSGLHAKGAIGGASAGLTFATVAGTIVAASSGVTLAQAWSNFAEAAASAIWNPTEVVLVKTPVAVTQLPFYPYTIVGNTLNFSGIGG